MKKISLLLVLLNVGCVVKPGQPVVVPPRFADIAIDVILKDIQTLQPIEGLGVKVSVRNDPPTFLTATTNADGYTLFTLSGDIRPFPNSYAVVEETEEYEGQTFNLTPESCHDGCHNIFFLKRKHVNPLLIPVSELRQQRGGFASIYIPEIAPQCPQDPITNIKCVADNGGTPRGHVNGLLFTANYRLYTKEQRKLIRTRYKERNYKHFPISVFCTDRWEYHGLFPPCKYYAKVGLNEALHELYDDHLIPVAFIMDDNEPNDLTTPLSVVADNPNLEKDLFRIVVPYWEHFYVGCATQKVHEAFPNALIYYHNPTSTDAPYEDECYPGKGKPYPGAFEYYGYMREHWGLTGLLLQTEEIDLKSLIGRIADFTASFGAGLRTDANVVGLDVVWFEDIATIYNNFWFGGNEEENLKRADQINKFLYTPLCEDRERNVVERSNWCGTIIGYNSGGTIR